MRFDKTKMARMARNTAGKALMTISLMSMVSMSVSAAGGNELENINNTVAIKNFISGLNAAGRIEYDANKDGNKEVFYDFKDYEKLGTSLDTLNQNEDELKKEYTSLYNLAESNRQSLINSWNRFGVLTLGQDAKYVTGSNTASIKGAMDAMPVHTFSEISVDGNGDAHFSGSPEWGVYRNGEVNTSAAKQKITEQGNTIKEQDNKIKEQDEEIQKLKNSFRHTDMLVVSPDNTNNWTSAVDMSETHTYRYVDVSGAINKGREIGYNEGYKKGDEDGYNRAKDEWYNKGRHDAIKTTVNKIPRVTIWDGVAVANRLDSWDKAAGAEYDDKVVLLEAKDPEEVFKKAVEYSYFVGANDYSGYIYLFANNNGWVKRKIEDGYTWDKEMVDGDITYVGHISVVENKDNYPNLTKNWYHCGSTYITFKVTTING